MEHEMFKGKYFRVTIEEVKPGLIYERVYQRHGITVFPLTSEGKIRFIRKTTQGDSKPCLAPMSGYIEEGENPLDCAKRELGEELGLRAAIWSSITTIPCSGGLNKLQYFYAARSLSPLGQSVEQDAHENILGYEDLTFDQAKTMALAGIFDRIGAENALALLQFIG